MRDIPEDIFLDLARIRAGLKASADDMLTLLARLREDPVTPAPVEQIDLGRVDDWMFEETDHE
jgi:hypothetical protein